MKCENLYYGRFLHGASEQFRKGLIIIERGDSSAMPSLEGSTSKPRTKKVDEEDTHRSRRNSRSQSCKKKVLGQ